MSIESTSLNRYRYRAYDKSNRPHKGMLTAASVEVATNTLKNQNLIPVEITPVSKTGWNAEITLFPQGKVKANELGPAFMELAAMYKSGLAITRALEAVQYQTDSEVLRDVFKKLRTDVSLGMPLSLAMEYHPKIFDALAINLVKVGEETGFLDVALEDLANSFETDADIREKVRSATTYPKVVGIMALVIVAALIAFIVPIFEGMFAGLNGELPLPTQVLVYISHNSYWILPLILVLGVVFYFLWKVISKGEKTRIYADQLQLKLPIFGKVRKQLIIARIMRALALMTKVGVPLLDALNIAKNLADNQVFEDAIEEIEASITAGRGIAAPMAASGLFPPMVYNLVAVGEDTGQLPQMLTQIANFFETDVKYKVERLSSTMEPVLLGVLGVIVGAIVISLYLPTFTLYSQIG